MDNKITRKRFADFLSYEWIVITVIILVAIFLWEVVFTLIAVKPTDGQRFKILYDEGVASAYEKDIVVVTHNESRTYSFDVLEIGKEGLTTGIENEIGVRYKTRDCDVIVTTHVELTTDSGVKYTRANYITESFNPWSYEKAVEDGDKYLEKLLKNGVKKITAGDVNASYDYSQMDTEKIDNLFSTRLKGDNRFRKAEQKAQGKLYERLRIEQLCKEVKYAKKLLREHSEIFYTYTLGQQAFDQATESGVVENIKIAQKELEDQIAINESKYKKEKLSYGIMVDKLEGGEYAPQEFFTTTNGECKDLVLMAFDFLEYQPHLQFESLSFMNSIVRLCSSILD